MKSFVLAVVSVAILFVGATSAEAQHYHRYTYRPYQPLTTGHYHDRAGHMVDSYGHHVDSYGHHTGGVGLYDGNVPGNYLPGMTNGYTTNYAGMAPPPGYGLPIKISNPAGSPAALRYTLNGYPYQIQPGEVQTLTNDRVWVVQFDRGGEFGSGRYTLSPGTYEFSLAVNGWELFQESTAAVAAAPSVAVGPAGSMSNPLPPSVVAPAPSPRVPAR